jgi:hypothetical protein
MTKDNDSSAGDLDKSPGWLVEVRALNRTEQAILDNLLLPVEERRQLLKLIGEAKHQCRYIQSGPPRKCFIKVRDLAVQLLDATNGSIFHVAKGGDWRLAAEWIRSGRPISKEMRAFLADVLEGKRRAQNRPPVAETVERNRVIVWFILEERNRGIKPDQSINNAADKFGLGRRRVQQIFREHENGKFELIILTAMRELQKQVADLPRT